jgi:DNA gyrase subunit A
MIANYVDYRNLVILNIFKDKLAKVLDRIEVVDGLLQAMKDIDRIIEMIKKSVDRKAAKAKLMKEFTERQADAILNMKLSSLSRLDNEALSNEWRQLQEKRKYNEKVIASRDLRNDIIIEDLKDIKSKYGDARKTKLGNKSTAAIKLSKEPVDILFFENGNVYTTQNDLKKLPITRVGDPLNKEGSVKQILHAKPSNTIAIFTKNGRMENYDVKTFTIDEIEPLGLGSDFVNAINIEDSNKEYLIFITKKGKVKKTNIKEYLKARKTTNAIKLKSDDELIYVGAGNNDDFVYILGEKGKLIKFPIIEATDTSRNTIGSKGINDAAIQALVAAKGEKVFTMNNKNQAKLTEENDFVINARGGNGQSINDGVVILLSGDKKYLIVFDGKKNNLISMSTLAVKSKGSVGAKIHTKEIIGLGN